MDLSKMIGVADVSVNINARVRVKLTDHGRELYRQDRIYLKETLKHVAHYDIKLEPKLDDEGYYCTHVWSLMELFGPHMKVGTPLPIFTEIIIEGAKIGEKYCLEINEKAQQNRLS